MRAIPNGRKDIPEFVVQVVSATQFVPWPFLQDEIEVDGYLDEDGELVANDVAYLTRNDNVLVSLSNGLYVAATLAAFNKFVASSGWAP